MSLGFAALGSELLSDIDATNTRTGRDDYV